MSDKTTRKPYLTWIDLDIKHAFRHLNDGIYEYHKVYPSDVKALLEYTQLSK